ncbi:hypothetical protein AU210_000173 [Fusarium oxysporum f. sp. radicis-cucumerinum]|uniref:Zn(2)-C6 fungal-type domain-containing protein n=1 Tax=Fusarium oxysporum f. sp. radicis-cucumerinum TaxID=327505 RepID=A0A2H3HQP5_FUSOX|nr:hypothetical protein AU210_000173 [Fusarium oxysporum f. sp. radicis-cucumerinum]
MQNAGHRQALPGSRRIRTGPRTQLACINCKERKLKCDSQVPSCVNCQRFDITCLVEDPATRRHQPRNYVETLEAKVAFLEDLLRKARQENTTPPVAASRTEDTPTTILGRPLGIPLQEVDAEFPLDIDDSNITETDILVEPRSPNSAFSTTMSTALHVFRLRKIWARLHASLYSDKYNMDNTTHDDRIPLFRAEIDAWLASTPPIPPRTGAALSILATQDWYDLSHSETIIMLYRGRLIDHLGGASDDLFLQCARAAESICLKNRRLYVAKPVNCTWGTLHVIFSAGLTYLHCLWTSAAVRHRTSLNEMSSTLTSCTMVLAVIAERFKGAAPYRDIFEALCTRTKEMMVDGGGEQLGVQISTMDLCYVMPGRFTQWMAEISDVGIPDTVDSLLAGLVSDCVTYEGIGELI